MKRVTLFFTFIILSFSLIGCQAKQSTTLSSSVAGNEDIQKYDSSVEQRLADCTAKITTHMLQSPAFINEQSKPEIIFGRITNTTGDDGFPIHIAADALENVVIESQKTTIVPYGTFEFDYTTHVAIYNAQEQDGSQKKDSSYTIRVQLLNYYGELIGQWSAKTSSF